MGIHLSRGAGVDLRIRLSHECVAAALDFVEQLGLSTPGASVAARVRIAIELWARRASAARPESEQSELDEARDRAKAMLRVADLLEKKKKEGLTEDEKAELEILEEQLSEQRNNL